MYVCGNPDMIAGVNSALEPLKKEKNINIFKEGFTLSSHYKGKFHHHIIDGNLAYKKHISWGIILFSLFGIIPAWLSMQSQNNLYGSFGIISNFMGFLYDVSWFSVVFVMGIRPLSDIFSKIKLFKTLCYFRKALGILSASIIVINWLGIFIFSPEKLQQYFLVARFGLWYPLIGRLSEFTALVLLLTSNSFSQKYL